MTLGFETLLVEEDAGITWVTLNRPDVINAMNGRMEDEIMEVIDRSSADGTCRVLVLRGAGRAFCAGHDVRAMGTRTRPGSLAGAVMRLEKPVVASLHGYVFGAAFALALACDLRIADTSVVFSSPFVERGVVGGTHVLTRTVGLAKAKEILFLGERFSGAEAMRLNLLYRLVSPNELIAATREVAGRLAESATRAIGLMKTAIHEDLELSIESGLANELKWLERARLTRDYLEYRQASIEKRRPHFVGY